MAPLQVVRLIIPDWLPVNYNVRLGGGGGGVGWGGDTARISEGLQLC